MIGVDVNSSNTSNIRCKQTLPPNMWSTWFKCSGLPSLPIQFSACSFSTPFCILFFTQYILQEAKGHNRPTDRREERLVQSCSHTHVPSIHVDLIARSTCTGCRATAAAALFLQEPWIRDRMLLLRRSEHKNCFNTAERWKGHCQSWLQGFTSPPLPWYYRCF